MEFEDGLWVFDLNILNEILGPEYDNSIAKQEEKT